MKLEGLFENITEEEARAYYDDEAYMSQKFRIEKTEKDILAVAQESKKAEKLAIELLEKSEKRTGGDL